MLGISEAENSEMNSVIEVMIDDFTDPSEDTDEDDEEGAEDAVSLDEEPSRQRLPSPVR